MTDASRNGEIAPGTVKSGAVFDDAIAFLRDHLFARREVSQSAIRYRFEHCLRVARIGRIVADGEGFDPDVLALGCLLHDVGKFDADKAVDHGRAGALVADDFLRSIGLIDAEREQIVQGIAMHTDGLWNPRTDDQGTDRNAAGRPYLTFTAEPTLLARSIGECDNIDRFGAYRVYDTMSYVDFLAMSTDKQREWVTGYLGKLERLRATPCATATATRLWIEALDVQRAYFTRLRAEISA